MLSPELTDGILGRKGERPWDVNPPTNGTEPTHTWELFSNGSLLFSNGSLLQPYSMHSAVLLRWAAHFSRESIVFWSGVVVLDPKFAQESESGLRSRQSPAGK
jgi:hypothetical protein